VNSSSESGCGMLRKVCKMKREEKRREERREGVKERNVSSYARISSSSRRWLERVSRLLSVVVWTCGTPFVCWEWFGVWC
jgi:hypothetical protein